MQPKKKICAGCNTLQFIWKTVGKDRYCKSCAARLEPVKPTMPRKPISPRSDKRAKQEVAYSVLSKSFLKRHPTCQMQIPGVCTGVSTEVHHAKGRIGDLLLDEQYFVAACHHCHAWAETHPESAREMGISQSRLSK